MENCFNVVDNYKEVYGYRILQFSNKYIFKFIIGFRYEIIFGFLLLSIYKVLVNIKKIQERVKKKKKEKEEESEEESDQEYFKFQLERYFVYVYMLFYVFNVLFFFSVLIL